MTTNSTTERVKVLIKQVGLKQGDFAEQCGITPQSFSRAIKNGFSVEYLMRIANTYKANYKWLYNGIGEMFAEEKAIGKAQFAASVRCSTQIQALCRKILSAAITIKARRR